MSTTVAETSPPPQAAGTSGLGKAPFVEHAPIRADLYGLEHLEAHARALAATARLAPPGARGRNLLRDFQNTGRDLQTAYHNIAEAARQQEAITTDAEWLLDNFHVIEENLREVRHDLPRGFYRELPKLADGPYAGWPRVYALALELIAHTDSSLDETNITRFIRAYQTVTPLTIGELWAVPALLRLGLLENLRRLARQTYQAWSDRAEALLWKAHLLLCRDETPRDTDRRLSPRHRQPRCDWSDPFVVHLLQLLRDHGPEASAGLEWLENHLIRRQDSSTEIVRREHQRQAANQVSVGNCVTSLRLLSALDWSVFFERTSLVEAALRQDPAGVYARQDFATRDRYRRAVERLARGSQVSELEIVQRVLELSRRQPQPGETSAHCGYYLLGPGRPELQAAVAYRPRLGDRFRDWIFDHASGCYFGSLAFVTALILAGVVAYGASSGAGVFAWAVFLLAVSLLPATELAVGLVHRLVPLLLPPRVLPKMDFKDGISPECATFVVMPTLLSGPGSARLLAERLEVHYLSNPDPQLRYALLTDFADAPAEHMPEDDALVNEALALIRALNDKYPLAASAPGEPGRGSSGRGDRFFLFHRHRQWNPVMGCWMGWERKRGKLSEFNRLLRGARDTSYTILSGDLTHLPPIRFVLTLDADTRIPREAAQRLVGTLAHPLNQPRYDPQAGRVVAGYGVLQPRVTLRLASANRSSFARIFAGSAGIDPYTTAVSDVYQDLFGRGTFTGKGIYAVDAFEAAVGPSFPENQILSHDLIEGNYARCGLVTDVELLDDFPSHYLAYARREHRWIRGDWQILPWLFRHVPSPEGKRRNPLPLLERWKILDNLRRSLVPPALVLLLLLGWTVLPGSAWFWTGLALSVPFLPLLLQAADGLLGMAREFSWRLQWRGLRGALADTAAQALLQIIFLADQALLSLDAIVRTLVRLYITRKHLLEWEAAAIAERRLSNKLLDICRNMMMAPMLAVVIGLLVAVVRPTALPAAAALLVAWFVSPVVAFLVSRPRRREEPPLTEVDRQDLRRLARKTWRFFTTFVTAEDHWLPPDNYQEDPKGQIAHRTSPTNIGFYLLSCLAAHDLGYLSLAALLDRLTWTFDTLDQLERSQGHFYNWYDTEQLKPLQPVYISTVDSGNLQGCLIALAQGLREKARQPLPGPEMRQGLADTLLLLTEEVRRIEPPTAPAVLADFRALEQTVERLHQVVAWSADQATTAGGPAALRASREWLDKLLQEERELTNQLRRVTEALHEVPEGLRDWARYFAEQVRDRQAELAALEQGRDAALAEKCRQLADRAAALADAMNFRLLYNAQRNLFSIGFNLSTGRLDNAHYDLLASEACLTSFLAVARGEAPRRHWFQLGRPLTEAAGGVTLVSWGGTMFEYLMPRLLLRPYHETLLAECWRTAVDRQIEYGRQNHVPWGISESAFNALDSHLDYQYQSFGVPGLGLKRGLDKDLVIAPYATALALAVHPRAALQNIRALASIRAEGAYGFYEAVDYTQGRMSSPRATVAARRGRRPAVVRCFMAHHQGMTLVALANVLLDDIMPRRFHAAPAVRSTELMLQERVPTVAPLVATHAGEAVVVPVLHESLLPLSRRLTTANTPHPRVHLLSNRRYSVLVTNAGAGASTWRDLDVTRWREDRVRDCWGQFCYIRDLQSGLIWSTGHQPLGHASDDYEVVFSTDKAEFRRLDGAIETRWEITVSPEQDAEVRRVTLTNHGRKVRELEVTSYAEIALSPHRADQAHPAFAKLFLETEFVESEHALLCRRRPRSADQKPIWAVHVLAVEGQALREVQYETDRARFLGRGRTPATPAALEPGAVLSGTTGPVLDPIFSLRGRVRVPAGGSVSLAFSTAVASSREKALALADHYHDFHGITRAFELAWAHSQVELRHLHLTGEDAHLYQRLAGHLVYAGPLLRSAEAAAANRQGQPGLWRYGISGDRPILLTLISEHGELPLVRQLLQAHTYWRLKGLEVDLVLLNEHAASYLEELHQELQSLIRTSDAHSLVDQPGGVFLRRSAQIADEDKLLLRAAARVVLAGNRGSLIAQVDRREEPRSLPSALKERSAPPSFATQLRSTSAARSVKATPSSVLPGDLLFVNGIGGFTPDGREYVIALGAGQGSLPVPGTLPPAPWINVVANPHFGFLVSECGAGYTWAGNSQMNRLTSWNNDPVSDPPSEALYLRDEATGEFWSPTPLPCGGGAGTIVRHGQGYTRFRRQSHGLEQELLLLVPPEDPIKLLCLKVRNLGNRPRRLTATFYVEWVLGTLRDQAPMQAICSEDISGALLAHNVWNLDFAQQIAFADVSLRPRSFTTDRVEFLGRNGTPAAPAALGRVALSGHVGPLVDPCAAIMAGFEVAPGGEEEVIFLLGQAGSLDEARQLLSRYRERGRVQQTLDDVRRLWDGVLGAVQVRTPDPALDLLLNRWLLYQVLSCRVWARSAFYQSGGAYGFRDQLQDVMALVYGAPQEARAQLLRSAARQFLEGDVQHWWHPPAGRGVRTRFSDDLLWLPLAVCHYVATTGDAAILEEHVPFLRAPILKPEQEEEYGLPEVTGETGSLYEHCVRALEQGYQLGSHQLPLMGTGDWNDGMNRVGADGKGESVWDGWFLLTILRDFASLAGARGDTERVAWCRERREQLRSALEEHAWDGHWYLRAFFDDGTPLGSQHNDECKIDSIVQSWAVISGAAQPERARQALAAVEEHLVREAERLILLFTPPFDKGPLQPGYIKGYVPGIRENGGQYTHAATWVVLATALLGRGRRALQLFDLLNPIRHAASPEGVARYRVEPYVVAADVYSQPPHVGRGGWTWYTGSAGWLYRVALETMLGLCVRGNQLEIKPVIASHWQRYELTYRYRSATYHITVENPAGVEQGVLSILLDGQTVAVGPLPLHDDGRRHELRVVMGSR